MSWSVKGSKSSLCSLSGHPLSCSHWRGSTHWLVPRITWRGVGHENTAMVNFCQSTWSPCSQEWWSVEKLTMLSSFEKEELLCHFFFLGKRHTEDLRCIYLGKGLIRPTETVSVPRVKHHRLSVAESEICSQVLSRPSWDGHLCGVATSNLMKRRHHSEGRWKCSALSAGPTCPWMMGSHLRDQWEARASLSWPYLHGSPRHPHAGKHQLILVYAKTQKGWEILSYPGLGRKGC